MLKQYRTEGERTGADDEKWMEKSFWDTEQWEEKRKGRSEKTKCQRWHPAASGKVDDLYRRGRQGIANPIIELNHSPTLRDRIR